VPGTAPVVDGEPGHELRVDFGHGLCMDDRVFSLDHFGGMNSGEIAGYHEEGLLRISSMGSRPGSGGTCHRWLGKCCRRLLFGEHWTGEGFAVPADGTRSLLRES
jgi:hypothetical protein